MPTGTLTKKIHGHENDCVSQPPSTSPNAEPPIAITAQTPSARARSFPSANVVEMIESAAGEISAAPSPCSARKPISIPELAARPFSSDAAVKMTSPMRKSRLRPRRSPARPPSKRKPPNTSVYALTIHWRLASESPRSFWIDGSATFTIVASRTTMNCARQTRTRTSQGLTEGLDSAAVVMGCSTLGLEDTFQLYETGPAGISPDPDDVSDRPGPYGRLVTHRTAPAAAFALLVVVLLAGCRGGGSGDNLAVPTNVTSTLPTATRTTPSRTVPTVPATTAPVTTEPEPATTTATEPERPAVTVTRPAPTTTAITVTNTETQTATVAAPVTTPTTTEGVKPGAAVAVGAAAASSDDSESSTDWGWIAFGILAVAVLAAGIVWWVRRRRRSTPPTSPTPP